MPPGVEFLVDPDDEPVAVARRRDRRLLPVLVAGAISAVVALVALNSSGSSTPAPRPTQPRPTNACAAHGCASVNAPTPAMAAAFRRVLPGSVVVAEHSVRSRSGRPALVRRTIEVVSGNVMITVLVHRGAGRVTGRHGVVDIEHGAYRIEYRFRGYYPPTRAELDTLSGDPRLTSPRD